VEPPEGEKMMETTAIAPVVLGPEQAGEVTPLTSDEQARLEVLELAIVEAQAYYVKAGEAFRQIQEEQLWRQQATTFLEYLKLRFGIQQAQAYRLMAAADVANNLRELTGAEPPNEAQARELAKLPPRQQQEVWQAAQEDGEPVTAAKLRSLVEEKRGTTPKRERATPEEAAPTPRFVRPEKWQPAERTAPLVAKLADEIFDYYDLDPCAEDGEDGVVYTAARYTQEDDGLAPDKIWSGTIWLAPDWGKGSQLGDWIDRLVKGVDAGEIEHALCYLPMAEAQFWLPELQKYRWGAITHLGTTAHQGGAMALVCVSEDLGVLKNFIVAFERSGLGYLCTTGAFQGGGNGRPH
jgi:hypothetical protein